jgi:hypothetical protein
MNKYMNDESLGGGGWKPRNEMRSNPISFLLLEPKSERGVRERAEGTPTGRKLI